MKPFPIQYLHQVGCLTWMSWYTITSEAPKALTYFDARVNRDPGTRRVCPIYSFADKRVTLKIQVVYSSSLISLLDIVSMQL